MNFRRNSRLHRLKLGFLKYKADVRSRNPDVVFKGYPLYRFLNNSRKAEIRTEYSDNIKYFKTLGKYGFGDRSYSFDSNVIEVPDCFSLIDSYETSLDFLKRLFNVLYFQEFRDVIIDYKKCNEIDASASMVMDIILVDFINYFNACTKRKKRLGVSRITPINYERYDIKKILYSIGAYKNIKNEFQEFPRIIPFEIRIGDKSKSNFQEWRDRHTTQTVEYIKECLRKVNRTLTDQAETKFYKVIGETLLNSEDHSGRQMRYLIGHFENDGDEENESECGRGYGVFNLSILNFGNTIYETFKSPNAPKGVVKQMEKLSGTFSIKKFFKKRKFEEETLWTLYALQEGVTSVKHRDRGNGAIQFIENFFGLKGNSERDEVSKMVITSGHTRIIFDGRYQITKGVRGKNGDEFKMMTFNETGSIEDLPDEKYVTYEDNYFPGTMISVKLKLDYENTTDLTLMGDDESNN